MSMKRNKEVIVHDITVLEDHIKAVKHKLNFLDNEEKLEKHKKNLLEVRKDTLNQVIEFYNCKAKETRKKLVEKSTIHSKFSMADQCYDRLLKTYKEIYLQSLVPRTNSHSKAPAMPHSNISEGQKQIEVLQKQLESLKAKIDHNTVNIKNLLQGLDQALN